MKAYYTLPSVPEPKLDHQMLFNVIPKIPFGVVLPFCREYSQHIFSSTDRIDTMNGTQVFISIIKIGPNNTVHDKNSYHILNCHLYAAIKFRELVMVASSS